MDLKTALIVSGVLFGMSFLCSEWIESGKTAYSSKQEQAMLASSMEEIADKCPPTENLDKLLAEVKEDPSAMRYWVSCVESIEGLSDKDKTMIAGVLYDISKYATFGRYEYKLAERQFLNDNQKGFLGYKGYTFLDGGTTISWKSSW